MDLEAGGAAGVSIEGADGLRAAGGAMDEGLGGIFEIAAAASAAEFSA